MDFARRAARSFTFWSACQGGLKVTFCLDIFCPWPLVWEFESLSVPLGQTRTDPHRALALLHLQLALVFFNERLKIRGSVE